MNLLTQKNNFLYLVMLAFIFISTSAMAINGNIDMKVLYSTFVKGDEKKYPPIPILSENTAFPILSAQGAFAVDLISGVSLYEKNADTALLPASTTKIITALVSLDVYKLDQVLTVPKGAKVDGQKMGLFPGEQMRVEDLLYGLLVYSANDAAETLAYNYPVSQAGGPDGYTAFVIAMNEKAKDLSMKNSHFDNPVGLDGTGQRSTAKDLVRASEVAMRIPQFAKIVGTKNITVHDAGGKTAYNLKNINELLGSVPGVLGVKTGWTENASENLVTYIERDGHNVMIAILGSQDRFGETKEMIDWIFANYSWQAVKPTY